MSAPTHPGALINAFISYARVDATKMNELRAALEAEGISVWIDREGIGPAAVWREDIARALDEALTVVFFLSPAFVRSAHCRAELHEAITRRKRLIPVRVAPLAAEERALVAAELSALNDIDAETPEPAAAAKVVAAAIRADPEWDAYRRWLLTSARNWASEQQDDGQLLRGASLETALAMLARKGKELSDLEKLYVQRSSQVAAGEQARLDSLRRRSFARRAQISAKTFRYRASHGLPGAFMESCARTLKGTVWFRPAAQRCSGSEPTELVATRSRWERRWLRSRRQSALGRLLLRRLMVECTWSLATSRRPSRARHRSSRARR
jgi:TIR domain